MKMLRASVLLLLTGLFIIGLSATASAAESTQNPGQLDSVLGVSWGASPAQVRQIMEQNGFSSGREIKDPQALMAAGAMDGTYIMEFTHGVYAGYPVEDVYVELMKNQMVRLRVYLWAENIGSEYLLNTAFDDIKNLLAEKYGVPRDDSRNITVGNKPHLTVYYWNADGDKSITLTKNPSYIVGTMKFSARIDVEYFNKGLYETVKNSSRQQI